MSCINATLPVFKMAGGKHILLPSSWWLCLWVVKRKEWCKQGSVCVCACVCIGGILCRVIVRGQQWQKMSSTQWLIPGPNVIYGPHHGCFVGHFGATSLKLCKQQVWYHCWLTIKKDTHAHPHRKWICFALEFGSVVLLSYQINGKNERQLKRNWDWDALKMTCLWKLLLCEMCFPIIWQNMLPLVYTPDKSETHLVKWGF